jgi:predicted negative regulator of RcsB-dependent stress response
MSDTKAVATPESVLIQASAMEQFMEKNFKKIIIGIVLVALAFVAFGVARYSKSQTELEAAEKFTSASTVEDCDVVIQKYAGTIAAGNALLTKADLQWAAGKKESSVDTLKEFLKSESKHPLAAQAQLGLASKQEALGDKAAAQASYETLLKTYPESELAPVAQIRIGDLAWADGKLDEAKKIYEALPRSYPGKLDALVENGSRNDQLQQRTELMNADLPTKEVDGPPPAPKPEPKAPTVSLPPLVPTVPMLTPAAPTAAPAVKLPDAHAVPATTATPPVSVPAAPLTPPAQAPTPPPAPTPAPEAPVKTGN